MGKKGDASTGVGSSAEGGKPPTPERKRGAWAAKKAARKPVGKSGVPGSVNPERRCTAKANRTGERCRRAAIKGGTVCTVHGGNLPQVRKKAKERLLELVEPALASLQKVLTDPAADDATKVRAALGILDRTGHGPGAKLEVGFSKFDALLEDAVEVGAQVAIERDSHPALDSGGGDHGWEDYHQASHDAQAEAWREHDAEDEEPYTTRLDPFDGNTVPGEVVQSRYDVAPDLGPTDPPRYWDEEAREADRKPT